MYDVTLKNRVKGINWNTAVFMALFHVGAVAALFVFNWKAVLVAILLWWVAGSLGVGNGFHRLLTHRSYKTPWWGIRVMQFLGFARAIKLVNLAQRFLA
jgi:fatty-acid desaturase